MGKYTVEQCSDIDIRWLERQGFFTPTARGNTYPLHWYRRGGEEAGSVQAGVTPDGNTLVLAYATKRSDEPQSAFKQQLHKLPVLYTDMPRGGRRRWLGCLGCGRRAAVLYLAPHDGRPGCRQCLDLAYMVQYQRTLRLPKSWQHRLDGWHKEMVEDSLRSADFSHWLHTDGFVQRVMRQHGEQVERRQSLAGVGLKAGEAAPPAAPVVEKRPRGRPRTKRAYTRHSLVSPVADEQAATCDKCGGVIPAPTGKAVQHGS